MRSIRALKHAVLLTIFCVSVFGLVGYQLFHGTLRQKCIRVGGSLDIAPDSLFVNKSLGQNQRENDSFRSELDSHSNDSSSWTLMFTNWLDYNHDCALEPPKSQRHPWKSTDAEVLRLIVNETKVKFNRTGNETNECFRNSFVLVPFESLNQSLFGSYYDPRPSVYPNQAGSASKDYNSVKVDLIAANITCLNESGDKAWSKLRTFGSNRVPRWRFRQFVIVFQFNSTFPSSNQSQGFRFLYYTEMDWKRMNKMDLFSAWLNQNGSQCKIKPNTSLFFYPNSPDRPPPEPIYCSLDTR